MNKIIHRAGTRGVVEHGWLSSRHTFSFAQYFNPERMGFGKLRVLNDDTIAAGTGFDTHAHENMEIVTIPIKGALRHTDSTGNEYVIGENEIQIMSAGTGIAHSEYNASDTAEAGFLQIWVLPDQLNINPRYEQKVLDPVQQHNTLLTVVAPDRENNSLWINQDAYFSIGDIDADRIVEYTLHRESNGLYVFIISGQIKIDNETLNERDAAGITGGGTTGIQATQNTRLLVIEVPMQ